MRHTADSRKKKRRRRMSPPSPSSSSSRSAAPGQWCCYSQSQQQLMLLLALALALLLPHLAVAGRMARIQSHLDRINKPALRSIRSADGDTIDCVAAHQQHALDHPLLKGHTIQAEPPEMPARRSRGLEAAADAKTAGSRWGAWQTWHHGGHCPRGTVAVRRTTAADVLRAGSISRFGRKKRKKRSSVDAARAANAPDVISGNGHEVSDLSIPDY